MAFLNESIILVGETGRVFISPDSWCGLLSFGMTPEPDDHGWPLPGEAWKNEYRSAMLDDEQLPVSLSVEQARIFADSLEFYSAGIPEKEEIGKVLSIVDREMDGTWKKFIVASAKGWVETSDMELPFIEDGKEIIHKAIAVLRAGSVTVELASDVNEAGW